MIRLVFVLVLLVVLAGCGDVYIAASEHGDAALVIEQEAEPQPPEPPAAAPSETDAAARDRAFRDRMAEIVAGFFVNTWAAVLLALLLLWLLFPPGDGERWR